MPDGLEIVSSGLLIPDVGVHTGVSGRTCQVFAISERNMLAIRRLVALSQTKIDNVNSIFCGFGTSNQKVIWLDVSMDNSLLMDHLDSGDHLHSDMSHSVQIELPSAFLE